MQRGVQIGTSNVGIVDKKGDEEESEEKKRLFESYVVFASKKNEEDEDVFVYERLEIKKDMCPKEGKLLSGEKYLNVELHLIPGEVVFKLKTGGSRIAGLDLGKGEIVWVAERKNTKPVFS